MHRDDNKSPTSNALGESNSKTDGRQEMQVVGNEVLLRRLPSSATSKEPPPDSDHKSPEQNHPPPPPFNPMQPSQSGPVHSVVPDLMRVYESLTNVNPQAQGQHHPQKQPPQPPSHHEQLQQQQPPIHKDPVYYKEPQEAPQTPTQHVNYSYITSEEQYRQLYEQGTVNHFGGHVPTSLPYIPAPYDDKRAESETYLEAIKTEESNSTSLSQSSLRRKRTSISSQQSDQDCKGTSKPRGRKKAKETDGRWSKRFAWPEDLHRDFVSAVFDVGLKHSSPSTILEHVPKHPQMTSNRIKSHLQKYRVHRTKSKQEFLSSYETTLQECKSADKDAAKSLSNGEAPVRPSRTAVTNSDSASPANQDGTSQEAQMPPAAAAPPPPRMGPPPPGQEGLMVPKLAEAEKTSPVGASMGHLLGLFFSLKKELLMQRNSRASCTVPGIAPTTASLGAAPGPVSAFYNSFNGTNVPTAPATIVPNPMAAPAVMSAITRDWSSGNTGGANTAVTGAGPIMPTMNKIEASSRMKQEMQNQMVFQNKMRELKQQELNKYKHIVPNPAPTETTARFKEGGAAVYGDQYSAANQYSSETHTTEGGGVHHQHHHQVPQAPPLRPEHLPRAGEGNEERHDASRSAPAANNPQGAGETAIAADRARAPSLGNDDVWNPDVMDEQLFEFLMNN
ncbi:expressed unknown protein [Seminavis robusta]|uniref:Uncharacterized protein n=1 Tax=Seminavis robusta TaxID=568900 RepID=A0A9N8HRG9_9STRA|nr:expressed unknown protein [Seminavis robusta]|eukprot:Sro1270_g258000.1 n/a (674) ;mRNA; r:24621-26642